MAKTPAATVAGRHSRAVARMDAVEIKVTIRPDEELRGIRALDFDEDSAEARVVYYYDTAQRDSPDAGLVLRARLVKGDDDDSVVKFRPVDPNRIAPDWLRHAGFKLEADSVGPRIVCAASLAMPQKRGEIDDVARGQRPIKKLFSPEQERFLSEFYRKPVDFKKLKVLGPIRVLRWQTRHKGFPYELTAEEWRLPDGTDSCSRSSIKVAPARAGRARQLFDDHLRALNLDPEGAQETKTRTALNIPSERNPAGRRHRLESDGTPRMSAQQRCCQTSTARAAARPCEPSSVGTFRETTRLRPSMHAGTSTPRSVSTVGPTSFAFGGGTFGMIQKSRRSHHDQPRRVVTTGAKISMGARDRSVAG